MSSDNLCDSAQRDISSRASVLIVTAADQDTWGVESRQVEKKKD